MAIDVRFKEYRFCPKCYRNNRRWATKTAYCINDGCDWEGNTSELLYKNELRTIKLKKINEKI